MQTHGLWTQSQQRAADAQTRCKQTRRKGAREGNTQLNVLVVSQDEDDVGPDVADVAVPLQAGPETISGQVAGAVRRREESRKEQKEKRERGREPPPCHDDNLQSPLQPSLSHVAVCSSCASPAKKETAGD